MTESQLADSQLVQSIRNGDEAAFLSVYRRLKTPIFRFAVHMSGSKSLAEDVTQETFMTLVHRSSGFDPGRGSLDGYLMGVARNCLLRRIRRDRGFVSFDSQPGSADNVAGPEHLSPDPLSDIVRDETIRRVRQAVLALPVHYREVLVLCELEERSYEDAAEILACATGTVRSRLHRAREFLVQKLGAEEIRDQAAPAGSRRCPA